jgi:hypothetical protein
MTKHNVILNFKFNLGIFRHFLALGTLFNLHFDLATIPSVLIYGIEN